MLKIQDKDGRTVYVLDDEAEEPQAIPVKKVEELEDEEEEEDKE